MVCLRLSANSFILCHYPRLSQKHLASHFILRFLSYLLWFSDKNQHQPQIGFNTPFKLSVQFQTNLQRFSPLIHIKLQEFVGLAESCVNLRYLGMKAQNNTFLKYLLLILTLPDRKLFFCRILFQEASVDQIPFVDWLQPRMIMTYVVLFIPQALGHQVFHLYPLTSLPNPIQNIHSA